MAKMKQFEVGKEYSMRSACNHDCVWMYLVVDRTASTVVLQQVMNGKAKGDKARFRIKKKYSEYCGAECVQPMGTYSMAPVLSADSNVALPKSNVTLPGSNVTLVNDIRL